VARSTQQIVAEGDGTGPPPAQHRHDRGATSRAPYGQMEEQRDGYIRRSDAMGGIIRGHRQRRPASTEKIATRPYRYQSMDDRGQEVRGGSQQVRAWPTRSRLELLKSTTPWVVLFCPGAASRWTAVRARKRRLLRPGGKAAKQAGDAVSGGQKPSCRCGGSRPGLRLRSAISELRQVFGLYREPLNR